MAYLLCYTRQPVNEQIYDPKLAYSVHLAVSEDGAQYCPLNHNSGVLFAKATENQDGSLNAKSLKNPWIFPLPDGRYGIAAIRVEGDGEADEESRGSVLLFQTDNLTEYRELGLLELGAEHIERVACTYLPEKGTIRVIWQELSGGCYLSEIRDMEERRLLSNPVCCEDAFGSCIGNLPTELRIEGALPQNVVEIPGETADRLCKRLLTPVNIGITFPEQVEVSGLHELERYRAKACYSDGSSVEKRVDWDLS